MTVDDNRDPDRRDFLFAENVQQSLTGRVGHIPVGRRICE
jgi:hypothetical protein